MIFVLIFITISITSVMLRSEDSITKKRSDELSASMSDIAVNEIKGNLPLSILVLPSNNPREIEEILETLPVDEVEIYPISLRQDELDQKTPNHPDSFAFHNQTVPSIVVGSILLNKTDNLNINASSFAKTNDYGNKESVKKAPHSNVSSTEDLNLPASMIENLNEVNNRSNNAMGETVMGNQEIVDISKIRENKSNSSSDEKKRDFVPENYKKKIRPPEEEKLTEIKESIMAKMNSSDLGETTVFSKNIITSVGIREEYISNEHVKLNLPCKEVSLETLPGYGDKATSRLCRVQASLSAQTGKIAAHDSRNLFPRVSHKISNKLKQTGEIVSVNILHNEELAVKSNLTFLTQHSNKMLEKQISIPQLIFPEVPEGEDLHVQELGLSEGIFVFSYLSSFLSWIHPHDFPVELLRDALWNRLSIVDLITQSLQVEVGFIICLTLGILFALGMPCILIIHACCRLLNPNKRNVNCNEDSTSETTNTCAVNLRRCTMVFALQLILLFLVAGLVSMFVTNEQMSRTVEETPSFVHTALNDVTTFLHNSHQQIRFVITKSLDQAVDAASSDLDNVEELLGRPIQDELADETGVDVALDALVDVSVEAHIISGKVEELISACTDTRELIVESREQLADLRIQVDMLRQQCPTRFRPLCNTVNASGLDVILRLDALMTDARLAQIRGLRVGNLSLVTQEARGEFQLIPLRVEKDTRDARNGVKRQLFRQKDVLYEYIWSLETVTRDLTYKVENGRNQALQVVRGLATIEQWRWFTGLGSALCVLLIWTLLLSGICCGCCGDENRAAPTLLTAVVLMCVLSIALWAVALSALLIGGHGEVFICRPLYDEPEYSALTRLVDRPGVLFQHGGGFFSNLLYRNGTIDVLLRDVLQKCKENGSTYSTFQLRKVFDVDTASNHRRWDLLHSELSHLHVNLSDFVLLTPVLQQELQDLLHASTVNLSNFRSQMTGQVTAKDLQSFADQMSSVANQITDWSTLNRLENLILNTRNLMTSYIQPLEQRKEEIVYQLTTLEMQLSPLIRQVNQSLSHFKTIQYFLNNQGGNIANQKSEEYTRRLIGYMDQFRAHVLNKTHKHVAPCRPVWDLYHAMRLLFCRHIIDPLNGFWFATIWCLLLFLVATPLCLRLVDHYKHRKETSGLLQSRSSESPTETLMISEQGAPWSTPGEPESDGW